MAQHGELAQGGIGRRTESLVRNGAAARRPGMLTFAALMIFVVAGLEGLSASLAFAGTGWWVTEAGNLVYANLAFWGVVDLIISIIALYAGIDILRGGTYGTVVGYPFAVVCAVRWLFVVPASPVLAVAVIALCVMVIYGLSDHSDYAEGS